MNPTEILHHEPKIFPMAEDWNAFVELANQVQAIKEHWFTVAAKTLQHQLRSRLPAEWTLDANFGASRDTKVHLTRFESGSLALAYGWEYEFHLILDNQVAFDSEKINELLKSPKFAPILNAFGRVDRSFEPRSKAMWYRNFSFGSANDGNMPAIELAWYAGNRTEEFVDQAVEHIEKFTLDPIITKLLTDLNQESWRSQDQD